MTRLFHVSENPAILRFEPRPPPNPNAGVTGDAVWAIDLDHLPHYLLPRDCPRVTLRCGPKTSEEDRRKFFQGKNERLIAIEMDWFARLKTAKLFLYEFPLATFELVDSIAGYYISRAPVNPVSVDPIDNLIERIVEHGYKLRLLPNLWPLRDEAIHSTVQFSIIRMRHAKARAPE